MILYKNDDAGNLFTDNHCVPTVHIDNTPGLAIKAYIAPAGAAATAEIRDTGAISTGRSAPSMTSFSSRGPNRLRRHHQARHHRAGHADPRR